MKYKHSASEEVGAKCVKQLKELGGTMPEGAYLYKKY